MKAIKFKEMLFVGMISIGTFFSSVTNLQAQTLTKYVNTADKYQQGNTDVRDDLARVKYHRSALSAWRNQYAKDKKAGNEAAMNKDRTEMLKARADLQRSKSYLIADKRDLMNDRRLAIRDRKDELRKDQKRLASERKRVDVELAANHPETAQVALDNSTKIRREVEQDKELLRAERVALNENKLAINNAELKANAEPAVKLYPENAVAYSGKVIRKK